jgi:hypothetical protein
MTTLCFEKRLVHKKKKFKKNPPTNALSYKAEIHVMSRSVSRAVEYEVARQIHTLEAGGQVGHNT